jgi:cysteine synthase A
MEKIHNSVLDIVGHTPTIALDFPGNERIRLRAKLESYNPTGSVKDRGAGYLMRKLFQVKDINSETTIVESSSGNFGVALAAYCKRAGLRFICVVDPNISQVNETLMHFYGAEVVSVTEPDKNGGFLLNRIRKVKEIIAGIKNSYWINQYENVYNAEAYYYTIGDEICRENEQLDYIFLGVSSGGTVMSVSKKVKEKFPAIKVIAVDVIGSVIFGAPPARRLIPGIGSSLVPPILKDASIDEVVIVDELSTIDMCMELARDYCVFVGGSSGSVYAGIEKYFSNAQLSSDTHVLAVFPDGGWKYLSTIYVESWRKKVQLDQMETVF